MGDIKRPKRNGVKRVRSHSEELPKKQCLTDSDEFLLDPNIIYNLRRRTVFGIKESEGDQGCHSAQQFSLLPEIPTTKQCSKVSYNSKKGSTRNSRGRSSLTSSSKQESPSLDIEITDIKSAKEVCVPSIEGSIMKLPNEILMMIFSYFNVTELSTSVAPVCKKWYILAHSPIMWRRLYFQGHSVSTKDVKCILKKSPFLVDLKLSYRNDVEDLISQLCRSNHRVQSLTIKQCSNIKFANSWEWSLLRAKYLNRIIKCCPKLKSLKLNKVKIRSNKFYRDIGNLLPNLTCLHLSHSHYLTPTHITNIAKRCHSLNRLWLSGDCCCGQTTSWDLAFHTLFQERQNTLTHLQFDASRITNIVIKEISLCSKLKMLHLHKASSLDNEGLQTIASLKNLMSLRLHKASNISIEALKLIFESNTWKNLINLNLAEISNLNDECVEAIALHCPKLHIISLAVAEEITDRSVKAVLKHCSSLHYLDLYDTRNVTGSSFFFIPKLAKQLTFLAIECACDSEKESHLVALKSVAPHITVHRAHEWKTSGLYNCRLLN